MNITLLHDLPTEVIAHGGCFYCETPARVVLTLNDAPAEGVSDRMDSLATMACTCLGDILFGVNHRGTQRQRIREAVEECAEGSARYEALTEAHRLLALPRSEFAGFNS